MTTFDDWGAEYAEDFEYDLDVARVRREQAGVVGEALRLVSPGIVRGGSAPNITQRIQNKILSGVPLSRTDIDQIVPSSKEEATLSARVEIDPKLKSFWAITRAERDALQKSEEIEKALEKQRGQRNLYDLLDPGSERAVEAKRKLDSATEQIVKLRDDQSGIRTESQSAFEAFRKDTGIPRMGTVEKVADPRIAARVKAARAAELGRDPFIPRTFNEFTPDVTGTGVAFGPQPEQARAALASIQERATAAAPTTAAPTTAAPAASAATVAAPAVDTTASPGVPGDVTDPLQVKWDRFQQGALYQSLVAGGMAREDADRYLESVRSAAEGAGMSMDEWLARDQQQGAGGTSGVTFGPKGIETGQKWAPWTRDPAEAPGLAALKAEAAAAGMPGAMQLAYQQQSPETVWSRLGLAGEIARDPFTGDPISTAQLAPLAQRGIQDWFSRTVEPGYAFATARAAQQRAAGLPNELELGFENWARQAQERGRISPEEARLGQRAILDILQNPRDVLDPYAQETLGFLSETGGLDDYRNPRVIEALAAPMLQRISPIYRPGAKRNIQQEIANLQTLDPTSKMTSFFTGTPVPRPGYEPETFEALAGGMPLARGLPLGFNQFS